MVRIEYGKGESDPNGIDQHAMGAKTDKGKPDCSLLLLFGKALEAVAEVGTYGAEKYTRGGWQEVADGINRYTAAMLRHVFQENHAEYDRDLPVLHAAQVAWNALARLELMLREKENEDTENSSDIVDHNLDDICNTPDCEMHTTRCGTGCELLATYVDRDSEERPIYTETISIKKDDK